MRVHFKAFTILLLLLCLASCAKRSRIVSFRLYDAESRKPLSNMTITVYDGHDMNLPHDPRQIDNAPYRFGDFKTSPDGVLMLDLSKLRDPYGVILVEAGKLYKYIRHKGNRVKIVHYKRQGYSLRVVAHHNYDLRTKLMTITTIDSNLESQPKKFDVVDVPMDR